MQLQQIDLFFQCTDPSLRLFLKKYHTLLISVKQEAVSCENDGLLQELRKNSFSCFSFEKLHVKAQWKEIPFIKKLEAKHRALNIKKETI